MGRSHSAVAVAAAVLVATLISPAAGASVARMSPPRAVHVAGRGTSLAVTWRPPVSSRLAPPPLYVATAHPSRRSCRTRGTRCTIAHLVGGTTYDVTVVAYVRGGQSGPSIPSNTVTLKALGPPSTTSAAAHYLAASAAFNSQLTAAEAAGNFPGYAPVFTTLAATLSSDEWPTVASADVATLVSDLERGAADAIDLANGTFTNGAIALSQFDAATIAVVIDDAHVRNDLNLPQVIVAPSASSVTTAPLGTAQSVGGFYGDSLSVNVTGLLDPATVAGGVAPAPSGQRYVAVEVSVTNSAATPVAGDADLSTTLLGSDQTLYSSVDVAGATCTNFTDGFFELAAGATASGCVVFSLPTSVAVSSVTFSLASGYLDGAQWTP